MLMDTNGDTRMLLLKDLCSRLPYGVIVKYKSRQGEGDVQLGCGNIEYVSQLGNGWWKECKPYLRPMSSMTEEEEIIYEQLIKDVHYKPRVSTCCKLISWLKENYFDYNYLTEKGLAIEAPEDMYKY